MQKGKKFLSDLKLHSDYFKWLENVGRYETWDDACEDIINGHRLKYAEYSSEIEPYLLSALESMKEQSVLASQRNLQYRYPQIMKHNTRMFNCTSGHIARNRVFQEIFYLALSGCGFGGGLLIPFVNNLSRIQKRTLGTKTFVVPDSIEGWSDALGVLMSSYFVDKQPFPEYAGYEVKFDYSLIREKGAFISGGFKAPGPDGLKQSLERIETLIEKWIDKEGNKIRPILAFDIICHSADAVLSGGVRRSALNMIVDPNDDEMIHAKTGNWRSENPQRARSNNSVLLLRGEVTKEQFEYLVKLNDGDNDIGFVFANSWFDMFNPCVSNDTLINTPKGLFLPSQLSDNTSILLNSKVFESKGFRQTGVKPVFEIETEFGRKIKVTGEHVMYTKNGMVSASELNIGDTLTITNNVDIEFTHNENDEFKKGYLVGTLLGDGNFSNGYAQIKFWGENNNIYHNKMLSYLNDLGWSSKKKENLLLEEEKDGYTLFNSKELYDFIKYKDYSVIDEKRLTKKLLSGSFDYINGIISGYFDADGTVIFNKEKGNSVRITSTQLENLENLQIGLNSFGVYSKIYKFRNKSLNGVNLLPDGNGDTKEYEVKPSHELVITNISIKKFNSLGFLNIKKREIINQVLSSYVRDFNKTTYEEVITNINYIVKSEDVYDCEVQSGVESFDCNGFYVHNCFEILKIPVLMDVDFSKIHYNDIEEFVRTNNDKFGIQGCNLTEINAEKSTTKEKFFKACRDASILGTLQAGYTYFPYLGETTKKIFEKESLLGVSITGWMNNPKLFNAELLKEGAEVVKKTNKEVAQIININQAARTTCVKPSGNASVVLGTASGIHPEHSEKYFRVMQLNKESNTAKWLTENMPFLLEESVWSSTNSDYVVFVPVENPKQGLFKKDMKGIKHLELIKLVQQNWVNEGTNPELCTYSPVNHNTSCFTSDVKFLTDEGVVSFDDVKNREFVNVLNKNGEFSKSKVSHHGKQEVYELILGKGKSRKVIKTTQNHKWFVKRMWDRTSSGKEFVLETKDLEYGMKLSSINFDEFPEFNLEAFLHGVTFGDGTYHKGNDKCQTYLFDNSRCLYKYFELGGYSIKIRENDIRVHGLPNHWKKLPEIKTPDYIRSFIAGWFAADGHISKDGKTVSISSVILDNLNWLQQNSCIGKIIVNQISQHKFGDNPYSKSEYFYTITLNKDSLNDDFFKHDKKYDRWVNYLKNKTQKSKKWKVLSVKPTGILEDVYCVEEPITNGFVLEGNILTHNCTVIIDDKDEIVDYIWDNKEHFTAVSFLGDYGDKDFNQAPFTSVLSLDEIVQEYGKGSVLASGLVVDGLHYFNDNLWLACDTLLSQNTDRPIPVTGTREQVLLKDYWLKRAKKFAKNYFKGDLKKMVYCLKDVHLFHKWETITRQFKEVNFGEILDKPQFKDISDYAAQSCSGAACDITRI